LESELAKAQQSKKDGTKNNDETAISSSSEKNSDNNCPSPTTMEKGDNDNDNDDELVVTTIQTNGDNDPDSEFVNVQTRLEQTIDQLKENIETATEEATKGSLIGEFLQLTSHQLTQHGLIQLHQLKDDSHNVWVFFRNNHFGTLVKHDDGHMYLLVTDLGYASVPEIVWEKLDVIDGNTQHFTQDFTPSKVMGHLEGGRMPEDLQSYLDSHPNPEEATDYLLALSLATSSNPTRKDQSGADSCIDNNDDDSMLAAATNASLEEYRGGTIAQLDNGIPTSGTSQDLEETALLQETYSRMAKKHNEAASEALAKQLQETMNSEDASLSLAQKLQNEEYQRQPASHQRKKEESSACVIS